MAKIFDYEFKIWEISPKSPRSPRPETFLWGRLNVEVYTNVCAESPFEPESINWESETGIGGILVVNGIVVEFPPARGGWGDISLAKGDTVFL